MTRFLPRRQPSGAARCAGVQKRETQAAGRTWACVVGLVFALVQRRRNGRRGGRGGVSSRRRVEGDATRAPGCIIPLLTPEKEADRKESRDGGARV
jgi:hypothetical protein